TIKGDRSCLNHSRSDRCISRVLRLHLKSMVRGKTCEPDTIEGCEGANKSKRKNKTHRKGRQGRKGKSKPHHSAAAPQPKSKTHHGGTEARRKIGENQLHRGGAEKNLISMKN